MLITRLPRSVVVAPAHPRILASARTMASSARPTRLRPHNWKELAPAPLPGLTFAAQANLPRLPVPTLDETLVKLKESLRPIAYNEQEYAAAVRKIDEFAAGPARELQKRLEARRASTVHWLEEWWDDGGYLTYRDSVAINVSYYYGFREHPSHLPQTPAHRAASLVRSAMLFREQFKLGQLPPEATKEGPICVDTYRWMFDCCRVPGKPADWSVSYAREGDRGDSGHVVVLRRGRVWKLEPWKDGRLLSVDELLKQIEHIYENTKQEYPAVGLLTAHDRDFWTEQYDALAADPHNESILRTIHSSAFVLCLDTEGAPDFIAHSRLLWHGAVTVPADGVPMAENLGMRNRWMDKPLQFVVADDGKAGFVGEHSIMDGTPTVALCDRVLDTIAAPEFASSASALPSVTSPPATPTPLDWHISAETRRGIIYAAGYVFGLIATQNMDCVRTAYGKRQIKEFGVSPDSWAQMLVQLAYARLLRARGEKRRGGTYEAASTRRFFKGRTEAIRVVSREGDEWVESMDDKRVGVKERGELFGRAVEVHGQVARMAGKGLGVDRHLLGLKKAVREGEAVPALFSDPVVARSSYWVLSTSAIFSKHFGPYGWGEVVPDGFGVAYMTGFDDYLQYTITSQVEMPNEEFCEELKRAAQDMFDLHAVLAKEKAAEPVKAKL
ncbi:carnitine acetyl transferase [Laetiporus sulphureus 93-53]|uniref:Carnitine acetyl transferase n=1 Tax=Laetiporus sulphureus 93-53 TaxID=1314785 RepID=A0A165EKK2_9APHY|nr:carnitine acetyl transferase [Laetiporus sulphureus 93-53]KZT07250.1 carnitine acetyl transferase [Laetiporus sulphureus 93-53]